eukprot:s219_g20.t1
MPDFKMLCYAEIFRCIDPSMRARRMIDLQEMFLLYQVLLEYLDQFLLRYHMFLKDLLVIIVAVHLGKVGWEISGLQFGKDYLASLLLGQERVELRLEIQHLQRRRNLQHH